MYKLFFVIFLIATLKTATSQGDSILVQDSIHLYEFKKPFSKDEIEKRPVINKIINIKETDKFKPYFFLFLLNLISITVLTLNVSREKAKKLLKTISSINVLSQYSKAEFYRDNTIFWTYLIQTLIFTVILITVISYKFNTAWNIINISLTVFTFFLVDFIIHKVSAFLFNLKEIFSMLHFNNFSTVMLFLPILILGNLLILFSNPSVSFLLAEIMFILIVIVYLFKEFRNLLILKANRINIFSFYFFIYLCTFKILPVIILFKILTSEMIKT